VATFKLTSPTGRSFPCFASNYPGPPPGPSLITAPLLGLVAACAWPPLRTGDPRPRSPRSAPQPGRWYVFSLFLLLSTIMLVPAVLALMRLLGHTRPVWALTVGCLAQLGILIGVFDSATQLMFWQMAATGRQPQPDGRAGHPLQTPRPALH